MAITAKQSVISAKSSNRRAGAIIEPALEQKLKVNSLPLASAHPDLFRVLKRLADGLTATFGKTCEVVIHDLSDPTSSVVHVSNGRVTNRKVGDGIRDMAMVLRSPRFSNDTLAPYLSETSEGRRVKSMTTVIRDDCGDIVGAFCLNLDLEPFLQAQGLLEEFTGGTPLESPAEESPIHDQDVLSILQHIIRQTISKVGIPVAAMDKDTKVRIVGFLDEREVFRIKGAVDDVAKRLDVSRYTIYNYLDEVRKNRS